MNDTLKNFGYPNTLIKEYTHWCVLLRPQQVTLGSLILVAKAEVTSYADLPEAAFVEQKEILQKIENSLKAAFKAEKFNYLMLMMVDPHPHFHVLPRYSTTHTFEGVVFEDTAWPGPPNLGVVQPLSAEKFEALRLYLLRQFDV